MNKYLIFLRGINVGGNNIIRMSDLKSCLESFGFENVKTYIQSGNVIVESKESNEEKLTLEIEKILSGKFEYESKIVLINSNQYKKIIENAPEWWGKDEKFKHNLLFIKPPMTAEEALILSGVPKENIEIVAAGTNVIYHSSSIEHATKTNFVKLPSKPVYKHMTIRNWNTSMKLLELLDK